MIGSNFFVLYIWESGASVVGLFFKIHFLLLLVKNLIFRVVFMKGFFFVVWWLFLFLILEWSCSFLLFMCVMFFWCICMVLASNRFGFGFIHCRASLVFCFWLCLKSSFIMVFSSSVLVVFFVLSCVYPDTHHCYNYIKDGDVFFCLVSCVYIKESAEMMRFSFIIKV